MWVCVFFCFQVRLLRKRNQTNMHVKKKRQVKVKLFEIQKEERTGFALPAQAVPFTTPQARIGGKKKKEALLFFCVYCCSTPSHTSHKREATLHLRRATVKVRKKKKKAQKKKQYDSVLRHAGSKPEKQREMREKPLERGHRTQVLRCSFPTHFCFLFLLLKTKKEQQATLNE